MELSSRCSQGQQGSRYWAGGGALSAGLPPARSPSTQAERSFSVRGICKQAPSDGARPPRRGGVGHPSCRPLAGRQPALWTERPTQMKQRHQAPVLPGDLSIPTASGRRRHDGAPRRLTSRPPLGRGRRRRSHPRGAPGSSTMSPQPARARPPPRRPENSAAPGKRLFCYWSGLDFPQIA